MIGKKLYKGQYTSQEYAKTAVWCNDNNAHLEDKSKYYEVIENIPHIPTIQDQINELENQITARNLRSALIGDEFAINKIKDIEMQIDVLREQLQEE